LAGIGQAPFLRQRKLKQKRARQWCRAGETAAYSGMGKPVPSAQKPFRSPGAERNLRR